MKFSCVAVIFVACFTDVVTASSIYVKSGYKAGMRAAQSGEEVTSARVCEDSNKHTCHKIQQWYGARACSQEDPLWADTMKQICPRTCGFCDCKDKYKAVCVEYSHLCSKEGDLGNFMKEICAKTCGTCSDIEERMPQEGLGQ